MKERSWAISSDSDGDPERSGGGAGRRPAVRECLPFKRVHPVLGGGQGNRQGSLTCVCFPPVLEKTRIKASCR